MRRLRLGRHRNRPGRALTARLGHQHGAGGIAGQGEAGLPAAAQLKIDLGEQLHIQQCIVGAALAQVDIKAAAQRIEAIGHAGEAFFRQCQRVDHARSRQGGPADALQFGIQMHEIKRRIMGDDRRIGHEIQPGIHLLGEERRVFHILTGHAMDAAGIGGNIALFQSFN